MYNSLLVLLFIICVFSLFSDLSTERTMHYRKRISNMNRQLVKRRAKHSEIKNLRQTSHTNTNTSKHLPNRLNYRVCFACPIHMQRRTVYALCVTIVVSPVTSIPSHCCVHQVANIKAACNRNSTCIDLFICVCVYMRTCGSA